MIGIGIIIIITTIANTQTHLTDNKPFMYQARSDNGVFVLKDLFNEHGLQRTFQDIKECFMYLRLRFPPIHLLNG